MITWMPLIVACACFIGMFIAFAVMVICIKRMEEEAD